MKRIIIITVIACNALFFLQCLWINNTYEIYRSAYEQKVDSSFYQSISLEVSCRRKNKSYTGVPARYFFKKKENMSPDEVEKYLKKDNDTLNIVKISSDSIISGSSFQNVIMQMEQDILIKKGEFICLPLLDSIFTDISQIQNKRSIILFNSHNEIIEMFGDTLINSKLISSKPYQIGNNGQQFVQIHVCFPLNQYLHNQFFILSVSIVIIIIVFIILLYQLTVIRKKDALLTARENSINGTIHDLKSPLSNIVPLLEWLGQSEKDSKKKELLHSSKIMIKHLATDIDELLHVAKGVSGNTIMNPIDISLEDLIQNALEKVSCKLLAKPHTISVNNILNKKIFCDRMYAENVVRNIIENSLKYSDDGVCLTIKLYQKDMYDIIDISDTGWGIKKKHIRKVYRQFYQVATRATNGYGIGLSYVKSIMEAHGGKVTVDSTFGKGTSVKCYFPSKISFHE